MNHFIASLHSLFTEPLSRFKAASGHNDLSRPSGDRLTGALGDLDGICSGEMGNCESVPKEDPQEFDH